MYQNILFDLDGTLTNSELGITNSVADAIENIFLKKASMKMKFIKGFGKYCLLSNKLIRN